MWFFGGGGFVASSVTSPNAIAIDSGKTHYVALLDEGGVVTWGNNQLGQLGTGDYENTNLPKWAKYYDNGQNISAGIVSVCCSENFTLLLTDEGSILAAGSNGSTYMPLGDNSNITGINTTTYQISKFTNIYDEKNVIGIAAGKEHILILLDSGKILAMGSSQYGQMGIGIQEANRHFPLTAINQTTSDYNGSNAVFITCNAYTSYALLSNGNIISFGRNNVKQCLINNDSNILDPRNIQKFSGFNGNNAISIKGSYREDTISIILNNGEYLTNASFLQNNTLPLLSFLPGLTEVSAFNETIIDSIKNKYIQECENNDLNIQNCVNTDYNIELSGVTKTDDIHISGSIFKNNTDITKYLMKVKDTQKLILDASYCGYSIDVFKNYAIIGSPEDNEKGEKSGSVIIFNKVNGTWEPVQNIIPDELKQGDTFGMSVGIYNDFAIIGAPAYYNNNDNGKVYIYKRKYNSIKWGLYQIIDSTTFGANDFGLGVSINNDYAVISFKDSFSSEKAFIFMKKNNFFEKEQELKAKDETNLGTSISSYKNLIIIGTGKYPNDNTKGFAYIFEKGNNGKWGIENNSDWNENKKLTKPENINELAYYYYGWAVAITDKYAFVGAPGDGLQNESSSSKGCVYIYKYCNGDWNYENVIRTNDRLNNADSESFGSSLTVSSNILIVGAYEKINYISDGVGSIYIYENNGEQWNEVEKIIAPHSLSNINFGWCISSYEGELLVGSSRDISNNIDSGKVYSFNITQSLLDIKNQIQTNEINFTGNEKLFIKNTNNIIKSISGWECNLIILNTGKVVTYGLGRTVSMGNGTNAEKNFIPVDVSQTSGYDGTNAVSVSNNLYSAAILLNTGKVLTYGKNQYGVLGHGTDINSYIPVRVYENDGYDGTNAVSVSCGQFHTGILLKTGKVLMFGDNWYGQLGNGKINSQSNIPVDVSFNAGYNGTNAIGLSCCGNHSAILLNTGKVVTFGRNEYGQLGNGDGGFENDGTTPKTSNIPVAVSLNAGYNGTNAIMVKCGKNNTAILLNNGKVVIFGSNVYGQLGDGTFTNSKIPVAVIKGGNYNETNAISISLGHDFCAILLNTGGVATFGSGDSGQLGYGGIGGGNVPYPVSVDTIPSKYDGTNAINVECCDNYTIILLNTGELVSFGYNGYGSLSIGDTDPTYFFYHPKDSTINIKPAIFGINKYFYSTLNFDSITMNDDNDSLYIRIINKPTYLPLTNYNNLNFFYEKNIDFFKFFLETYETSEQRNFHFSGGNVGIGTNVPTHSLSVCGATATYGVMVPGIHMGIDSNGSANIEICADRNNDLYGAAYIDFKSNQGNSDYNARIIYYNNSNLMRFETRPTGGAVAKSALTITTGGQIGIGTDEAGVFGDSTNRLTVYDELWSHLEIRSKTRYPCLLLYAEAPGYTNHITFNRQLEFRHTSSSTPVFTIKSNGVDMGVLSDFQINGYLYFGNTNNYIQKHPQNDGMKLKASNRIYSLI